MRQKLIVNNIKCGGCETTVKDRLSKIEGVENISADASTGAVEFDCSNDTVLEKVKHKLNSLGYTESDPDLIDTAKSYVSCMIGKMKQ
ncbi:MAG: heavy metal-associated domain-containing protein [Saprospiraceae bacterium]|nr:heavy metal-associated domain-containing protein [Saprospiraceae bacterium]